MSKVTPIEPARPNTDGSDGDYMPRAPWKWILGGAAILALAYGTYSANQTQEANAQRAAVLRAHRLELAPVVVRYEKMIGRINAWTVAAAIEDRPEAFVDPRLNLDALHKGKGLYLRVPAAEATTPAGVVTASQLMGPDAITRCLGLTPWSARGLYAQGSFLTAEWIRQAEETDNVMKLRVMAEEIKQRTERDLPGVHNALQAEWFMLVLERGEDRRTAPVDAYIWSLGSNKLLLRQRVQAQGALVAARIAVGGTKPGQYASGAQTAAAHDCSIASQLRQLAGSGSTAFAATPPTPKKDYEATIGAAANADATATGDAGVTPTEPDSPSGHVGKVQDPQGAAGAAPPPADVAPAP